MNGTRYVSAGLSTAVLPYKLWTLGMVAVGQMQLTDPNEVTGFSFSSHPDLVALPLGPVSPSTPTGTQYIMMQFTNKPFESYGDTSTGNAIGEFVISIANETNPTNEYAWIDASAQIKRISSNAMNGGI